jgi:hypothetical protein
MLPKAHECMHVSAHRWTATSSATPWHRQQIQFQRTLMASRITSRLQVTVSRVSGAFGRSLDLGSQLDGVDPRISEAVGLSGIARSRVAVAKTHDTWQRTITPAIFRARSEVNRVRHEQCFSSPWQTAPPFLSRPPEARRKLKRIVAAETRILSPPSARGPLLTLAHAQRVLYCRKRTARASPLLVSKLPGLPPEIE